MFGLAWVTDNLLASGSRDGTVKLWTVPDEPVGHGRGSSGYGRDNGAAAAPSYAQISSDPNDTLVFHYDKVRDLKWCERIERLVSVSTDGRVCFSDVERVAAVEEKRIRGKRELVCVATDGTTCAAGSQSHITVFDHRLGGVVRDERLVDNSSDGVRPLSFAGDGRLLTCGGGGGKLTFFDMRAGARFSRRRVRPWRNRSRDRPGSSRASPRRPSPFARRAAAVLLQRLGRVEWKYREPVPPRLPGAGHGRGLAGPGASRLRGALLARAEVLNACYAHAWDETGTRLLVGGGPLAHGLRGVLRRGVVVSGAGFGPRRPRRRLKVLAEGESRCDGHLGRC